MRKLLALLFLWPAILAAQGITYHNRCQVNAGTAASQCSVTVYAAGTLTLSSLYTNEALTTPKANPFTADTNGRFTFYAAAADYDILMSGGTPALPATTLFDVSLGGSGGGGGSGTVTSINFSATPNGIFDVGGVPITSAGTIALSMDAQTANLVLAGPSSGGAATPAFRALVDADIPNTITISLAATATALASDPTDCAANQFANAIAASGNLSCAAIADADVPDSITISLAAAATALAANPTDCPGGQFANAIDAQGNLTCATPSTVGTVTSVGLSAPSSILSVAGSPVTSSGTLALSLTTQTANLVWAGPSSGGAATPTFRALVDADVPDTITISLANTATAFAANPTDCLAGQFANAIDAQGNLTCSATAGSGDVLGPATHADNLVPQWNGIDTKTLKAGLVVSQTATVSALAQRDGSGNLAGNILGNAATATALAANGSNCTTNQFNKGVNASGAAEDCAALVDADIPAAIARDSELPVPGGSTTQFQYNNAGAFGGLSTVTTDGTNLAISASAYTDIAQRAAPANPGAGTRRMFVDSSSGQLSVRTSAGTTVSLEAGGSGVAAGANTNIQFNESGAFGGDDELTWNTTTKLQTISNGVDGSYLPLVLRNSQANAGGSTNETVDLQFAFDSATDNARIRVKKTADYTTGANEDSEFLFGVDINGTLTDVLRLRAGTTEGVVEITGGLFVTLGGGVFTLTGQDLIQVYDANTVDGAIWQILRGRAGSTALQANDQIIEAQWQGLDSGAAPTTFASLLVTARDVTNTTEDGEVTMSVMAAGTLTQRMLMDASGTSFTERIEMTKDSADNAPILFETNRTRAGASVNAGDEIWQRWHYARDSAAPDIPFFRERLVVDDPTSGSGDSYYEISIRRAGGLVPAMEVGANGVDFDGVLSQEGNAVALALRTITAGSCIAGGGDLTANFTLDLDLTECGSLVISNNLSASMTFGWNLNGTIDPTWTLTDGLMSSNSTIHSALGFTSGDGTTTGEYEMYELTANGTNLRSWTVVDALTASVRFRLPDTSPADSVMLFGTPAGGISDVSLVSTTGTGNFVRATSATLTTPVIASIVNTGTLTLPTSTDTLVGRATTDTFTNKTFDFEGTGNTVTAPTWTYLEMAGCQGTTSFLIWDHNSAGAPAAGCFGSNNVKGVADFDAVADESVHRYILLPDDFTGTLDIRVAAFAAATSGTARVGVSIDCAATSEAHDLANTNLTTFNFTPDGTTTDLVIVTQTGVTITGCAASELAKIRFFRDADGTSGTDDMTGDLRVHGVGIKSRRAM